MPINTTISGAISSLSNYASSLSASMSNSLDAEQAAFDAEVKAVKQWWSDSRWRHTRRPFTAQQIVAKRGSIKQEYANNRMSKKLWGIVENNFKNGQASFTYGCLDPVMVTQMAKYLDTVYVSGWQSSSTASATDEPGPDLADYPYVRATSSPVAEHHG